MEIPNEPETKYQCEVCNYKCIYPAHWKQHINSEKHKNNGKRKTRSDKVLEPKCKHCEYKTNNLTCMKVHCLTQHSNKEERKKEFKSNQSSSSINQSASSSSFKVFLLFCLIASSLPSM